MKFRLHYRGPLKSNGRPKDKKQLRQAFHPQLANLWKRSPLVDLADKFLDPDSKLSAVRTVKDQTFTAIVNETNSLVAKLNIMIMRPEEPGALITQGGDIDNRLKTLLDSLTIPKPDQLDGDVSVGDPTHCLLEDDNLITGLNVDVDRLLDSKCPTEVLITILVDVSVTRGTLENLVIGL